MLKKILSIFSVKEEKIKDILLSSVELELKKQRTEKEKAFIEWVFGRFSEIKHYLLSLNEPKEKIRVRDLINEEGNQKLRGIVQTSKNRMVREIDYIQDKFFPPKSKELDVIFDYCINSQAKLEREISGEWKNIAISKTLLRNEITEVGSILNELFESLKKLREEAIESTLFEKIPEIEKNIEKLKEKDIEKENLEKECLEYENEKEKAVEKRNKTKEEIAILENSEEFKKFNEVYEKIKEVEEQKILLRRELVNLIAPSGKVLRKFIGFSQAGKYFLEKRELLILNAFLLDPLEGIKKDPKGEEFKKLLNIIEEQIISGNLDFKEKDKEKKKESIRNLGKVTFFDYFWKINELTKKEEEIRKNVGNENINKKIDKLKYDVAVFDKRIRFLGAELERKKEKKNNLVSNISIEIIVFSKLVGNIFDRRINVILPWFKQSKEEQNKEE